MHWKKLICLAAFVFVLLPSSVQAGEVAEEWVRTYDGGFASDRIRALAVDPQGNVYVMGGSGPDYATIKYDADGNELWVERYNGGTPFSIAVDSSGNVYVTGQNGADIDTVKYDTNGNELWARRHDGGSLDQVHSIAVDSTGNAYVSGSTVYLLAFHYLTIKYDTNGNELWVRSYREGNYSFSRDMAVDPSGNVYVTGQMLTCPGFACDTDYLSVKYDTAGSLQWAKRYDQGYLDIGWAVALDSSGNVYVAGESTPGPPPSEPDYATVKYDANGNELWVNRHDRGGIDRAADIAVDIAGNAFVTGSTNDNGDYTTIKYDVNGNTSWVRDYDGGAGDIASAIEADSSGNVYVTGISLAVSSTPGDDYLTLKYDTDGNELWTRAYTGFFNPYPPPSLALDPADNVYVAGNITTGGDYYDFLTIKYSQGPTIETPADVIVVIEDMLAAGEITNAVVANALMSRLANAEANLETSPVSARNMLEAAINHIEAQSGKKVTAGAAEELTGYLDTIIAGF